MPPVEEMGGLGERWKDVTVRHGAVGMKQDVFHVVVFDPRGLGGGVTGGVEVKGRGSFPPSRSLTLFNLICRRHMGAGAPRDTVDGPHTEGPTPAWGCPSVRGKSSMDKGKSSMDDLCAA